VPEGWTKAAQVAAGNEDSSSLNTVSLTAQPTPKLYVQPVHPLFKRGACVPADCLGKSGRRLAQYDSSSDSSSNSLQDFSLQDFSSSSSSAPGLELLGNSQRLLLAPCLTTVAVTAAYDVLYNIDGGIDKKATMPKEGPPYISLTTLDTLAPVSNAAQLGKLLQWQEPVCAVQWHCLVNAACRNRNTQQIAGSFKQQTRALCIKYMQSKCACSCTGYILSKSAYGNCC
jgi:hypothetical protein